MGSPHAAISRPDAPNAPTTTLASAAPPARPATSAILANVGRLAEAAEERDREAEGEANPTATGKLYLCPRLWSLVVAPR